MDRWGLQGPGEPLRALAIVVCVAVALEDALTRRRSDEAERMQKWECIAGADFFSGNNTSFEREGDFEGRGIWT